ncbi:MAG: xylulokinase [Candidatus Omnitrophica bacterium]|nr:xylulokinase [Candidatus Omnitrophota bacterium]
MSHRQFSGILIVIDDQNEVIFRGGCFSSHFNLFFGYVAARHDHKFGLGEITEVYEIEVRADNLRFTVRTDRFGKQNGIKTITGGVQVAAHLLGIDVGTSGTKTILVDLKGKVIASAAESYPLLTPKPGWTEQDPEDWWRATKKTIRKVLKVSGVNAKSIKGIGFSGQMHGSVFLNRDHEVVRPCLLWNDNRTAEVCEEVTRHIGQKALHKAVSNPCLTGFTLPKVVWLKKHEPRSFEKVRHVILPKDYVRFRLTGEILTEVSDAAGTLMFDVRNNNWSGTILDGLGIPREFLPEVRGSQEVCGTITRMVAKETGLAEGTPCVGGAADQPAGAVGTGVVNHGQVMCSLGTSGVVFAATGAPQVDPKERLHTFNHAVPDTWYLMGCMLSAGGSLAWYRDHFADSERREARKRKIDVYEILMEKAARAPIGSEGLFFLPYLTGERSPHKDPYARGAFVGLSVRSTPDHLIRSIVEGVTFGLRDCLEVVRQQKVNVSEVRATGGGARSPFWRQVLADVLQAPIAILESEEGGAMGGAILASVGSGEYKDVQQACSKMLKVKSRVKPRKKNVAAYEPYYEAFTTLYPTLKRSFRMCVDLGA